MPHERILIVGAGAVGGWLGARLHAAGHDVSLLGRPALQHAVKERGLQVTGLSDLCARLPVHTTASEALGARDGVSEPTAGGGREYEIVVLTAKAHATLELAATVADLAAPDGLVVTLQNGLGNGEKLAAVAGADRTVVALTSHGLFVEGPGRIRHAGTGPTVVGGMPGADPAGARRFWTLLQRAGFDPAWTDDTPAAVWAKAAVNAAINPLGALHGVPNGRVLADHWPQAASLAQEVYDLSRAAGIHLQKDVVASTRATLERTPENRCSMLQDVMAERRTEIEQITGHFVRLARRLGYPLFENEAVYGRLKALEASYLGEEEALRGARAEAAWAPDT